jgi:hypothetical protein
LTDRGCRRYRRHFGTHGPRRRNLSADGRLPNRRRRPRYSDRQKDSNHRLAPTGGRIPQFGGVGGGAYLHGDLHPRFSHFRDRPRRQRRQNRSLLGHVHRWRHLQVEASTNLRHEKFTECLQRVSDRVRQAARNPQVQSSAVTRTTRPQQRPHDG